MRNRTQARPNRVMRTAYNVTRNPRANTNQSSNATNQCHIAVLTLSQILAKSSQSSLESGPTRVQHVSDIIIQLCFINLAPAVQRDGMWQYCIIRGAKHRGDAVAACKGAPGPYLRFTSRLILLLSTRYYAR